MSTPAAFRQRRSRAHRAGNHSLCRAGRPCRGQAAVSMSAIGRRLAPEATRGRWLWNALGGDRIDVLHRELLVEACRCLDRMEHLRWLLDVRIPSLQRDARPQVVDGQAVNRELRFQVREFLALCAELRGAEVTSPELLARPLHLLPTRKG